jgi:amino acid transporter
VASPARILSPADIALMVAGIVIGAGIFRAPANVAGAAGSDVAFIGLWLAGAAVALAGAFTYVALAARDGGIGGEYRFLEAGWGPRLGTLFVLARMGVIQTGALATVAFVAGDYLATLLPGPAPAWAPVSVAAVTLFNLAGLAPSAAAQRWMVVLVVGAMVLLTAAGFLVEIPQGPPGAPPGPANPGLALVFVMLVYGGWNEAAYLSGEVKGGAAGLQRGLVGGLVLVAALYMALNLAYLDALGLVGLAQTVAPAEVIARAAGGPVLAGAVAVAVILAALSTLNVTTITGARAMCALGQDLPALGFLGAWDAGRAVPRAALLLQGAVALVLTALGSLTRDGFEAMVAFTAPVFWLFLALVAAVPLKQRGFSAAIRAASLLFGAACLWMLWSSVGYARFLGSLSPVSGWLGFGGLILVFAGLPLAIRAGRREAPSGG